MSFRTYGGVEEGAGAATLRGVRLRYTVGEAGWADVVIECGGGRAEMAASYLHDSLRDLLSGTNAILAGAESITVVFADEPGEHHLNVRRVDRRRIALEVIWHDRWLRPGMGSGEGTRVLSCESTLAHLGGQVLSAATAIIDELGADGYRRKWLNHEFPVEQLEALRKARASS